MRKTSQHLLESQKSLIDTQTLKLLTSDEESASWTREEKFQLEVFRAQWIATAQEHLKSLRMASDSIQQQHEKIQRKFLEVLYEFVKRMKGTAFLEEFKDFIAFLQNLWGILAGISVFFPLSNTFVEVIPLAQKLDTPTYEYLNPSQVTVVTTLIALFVILSTFGWRHKLKAQIEKHLIRRQAWLSFAFGLLALILYFVLFFGIYGLFYEPLGIWSGDPRRLVGDIGLLLSYSTFFALITRAFMLLGMIEYFGQES